MSGEEFVSLSLTPLPAVACTLGDAGTVRKVVQLWGVPALVVRRGPT